MADSHGNGTAYRFCWADVATVDRGAARAFYCGLFGWDAQDRRAGDGEFGTFSRGAAPFASFYQLSRSQIEQGVPSHWTPYVSVPDVDAAAAKATDLGGEVIVPPHDAGLAGISLICDPAGALIGLWQASGGVEEQAQAKADCAARKGAGQA
jgi:predicted enzyme related to lactoylglutathione lyase